MTAFIMQIYNAVIAVIMAIYHLINDVFQWFLWFFPSLFNGDLIKLLGSMIRNVGYAAFSGVFSLLPAARVSVFDPYCGSLNWLIPVDYSIGCLAIIVSAIGLKMASGWILRWLW